MSCGWLLILRAPRAARRIPAGKSVFAADSADEREINRFSRELSDAAVFAVVIDANPKTEVSTITQLPNYKITQFATTRLFSFTPPPLPPRIKSLLLLW